MYEGIMYERHLYQLKMYLHIQMNFLEHYKHTYREIGATKLLP